MWVNSIELENTAPPCTRAVLSMKFRLTLLCKMTFAKVMIAIAPPLLPVLPSNVVEEFSTRVTMPELK